MAPRNCGTLESPDAMGCAGTPGRGAFMVLFLKLDGDRITAAKYQTYGCGPTIASGPMLTEMIVGKTIAECRELIRRRRKDLIEALDGVPPDKLHCPVLAIGRCGTLSQLGLRMAARHKGTDGASPPQRLQQGGRNRGVQVATD